MEFRLPHLDARLWIQGRGLQRWGGMTPPDQAEYSGFYAAVPHPHGEGPLHVALTWFPT